MTEDPKARKRRSKDAIRKDKARRAIKRTLREEAAASRRLLQQEKDSRAAASYCSRMRERERRRAQERELMYAGVDYICGIKSPRAALVARYMADYEARRLELNEATNLLRIGLPVEKKKKPKPRPSAKRKTELVTVHSPTLQGLTDRVPRVDDPLFRMSKNGQLRPNEWRVVERLREAFEVLDGQASNGSMDMDKVFGASGSKEPTPQALWAADMLAQAIKAIDNGPKWHVLLLILRVDPTTNFGGFSIEQCAAHLFGVDPTTGKPRTKHRNHIGKQFRECMQTMAGEWFPEKIDVHIRGWSDLSAPPTTDSRTVERGKVVHATADKIYRLKRG